MKKKRKPARNFDDQFRLKVLMDYYASGCSYGEIARRYDISSGNVIYWERKYRDKSVSLPSDIDEIENQVFMARNKKESVSPVSQSPDDELERLRNENARLRKALEYSELRNEALSEVLRIGTEQYGMELLKKLAPSRRTLKKSLYRLSP